MTLRPRCIDDQGGRLVREPLLQIKLELNVVDAREVARARGRRILRVSARRALERRTKFEMMLRAWGPGVGTGRGTGRETGCGTGRGTGCRPRLLSTNACRKINYSTS